MDRNKFVNQLLKTLSSEQIELINPSDWWWINNKLDNWRLTATGYSDFVKVFNLEHWEFSFDLKEMPTWIYLRLSKKLKIPFFIVNHKKSKLIVFDSKSALMIKLYGDLTKWIRTLE